MEAVRIKADLCRVVKEDASRLIAQAVAQAVFGRIVDPLLNPDLVVAPLSVLLESLVIGVRVC